MKIKITLLLFTAMLSVSTSPIIARYLENVPAVAISFWRMGFGAAILWIASLVRRQIPLPSVIRNKSILAGFFLGIHFALFFAAVKLTTIANATFLGTLAPLVTYFIEKFILRRNHHLTLLIGLGLALGGAAIIVSNQFDFSTNYTLGNLLAVSCSLFLGIAFIISENVRKTVGTISYSRTLFLSAAITLLGIAIISRSPLLGYSAIEFSGLFILGLIPTIFGHGFMYFAVKYVSPTVVASTPMGEPILASILAYFLFQEAVGIPIIIGGGFTLTGLFILTRNK